MSSHLVGVSVSGLAGRDARGNIITILTSILETGGEGVRDGDNSDMGDVWTKHPAIFSCT